MRVGAQSDRFKYGNTMPRPEASVIVPTLNSAETLDAQLAALAGQDFVGSWELIVADNGSTDTSRAIADRWRARLPALRVVDASDAPGVSHARNRGASAATGEFLLFCDSDDVVMPNWMSALVKASVDADAVGGCRRVLDWSDAKYRRGLGDGYLAAGITPLSSVSGGNLLVRNAIFEELGGFDENLTVGEDVDLGFRLQLAGRRLRFTNDAVILYRLRSSLKATAKQAYRYGRGEPYLYRKHRSVGMPRRSPELVVKSWGWLVLHAWQLLRRQDRGAWIWIAGKNLGRLAGSLRCRVVCL
jgi:GT2 family glycosyltransferase